MKSLALLPISLKEFRVELNIPLCLTPCESGSPNKKFVALSLTLEIWSLRFFTASDSESLVIKPSSPNNDSLIGPITFSSMKVENFSNCFLRPSIAVLINPLNPRSLGSLLNNAENKESLILVDILENPPDALFPEDTILDISL